MSQLMEANTHGIAGRLSQVACINEQSKLIVGVSRAMNLIAINAMLSAKQAGERARGFTVVAGEMRVFSRRLDESMEKLHGAISQMVRHVASLRKEQRQLQYLSTASKLSSRGEASLGSAIKRSESRMGLTECERADAWGRLCGELRQAQRLAQMAQSLANSAKIESAHGGSMAVALKQVADEIDTTAHLIREGVTRLNIYTTLAR